MNFTEELTASKIAALSKEDKAAYLKWEADNLKKVDLDPVNTTEFRSPLEGFVRDSSPNGVLNTVVDTEGVYDLEFDGTMDLKPGVHNLKAKVLWVGVLFQNKTMRMKASQDIWDAIHTSGPLSIKGLKGTVEVKSFESTPGKIRFWSDSETMQFA